MARRSPLDEYRRAQRRLRDLFEPFTASHCPTCPEPCCRKPTWVRPLDIVLVEELGYDIPARPTAVATFVDATLGGGTEREGEPCDFLNAGGCAFPDDLRPFGCAAMICQFAERDLPLADLDALRAAVRELEQAHAGLVAALSAPPDIG